MFALLVGIYWFFELLMLGTIGHLLFLTSKSHFVLIVGAFLLTKTTKALVEWLLYKKKLNSFQALQQAHLAQNTNQSNLGVKNV